jgi:hypothetical protein
MGIFFDVEIRPVGEILVAKKKNSWDKKNRSHDSLRFFVLFSYLSNMNGAVGGSRQAGFFHGLHVSRVCMGHPRHVLG